VGRAAEEEDATDELVTLLLDDLGPALQWYRDEVARTLGLSPGEVLCLEVCRRHGSMSSGRLGERLGLTRSAVAKMLRRLEEAGHVARLASPDHEQEIEVEVRPHTARDAVLDAHRRALRRALREMVGNQALHGRKHAVAATAVAGLATVVFTRARAMADATIERRLLAERRRAREAGHPTPWWAR
jgi:DNA-binding MarR family transcriptional regulator